MEKLYSDDFDEDDNDSEEDDGLVVHKDILYLRSEMKKVIEQWDKLLELGDEDALAMFIGKCILRVQRVPMVGRR